MFRFVFGQASTWWPPPERFIPSHLPKHWAGRTRKLVTVSVRFYPSLDQERPKNRRRTGDAEARTADISCRGVVYGRICRETVEPGASMPFAANAPARRGKATPSRPSCSISITSNTSTTPMAISLATQSSPGASRAAYVPRTPSVAMAVRTGRPSDRRRFRRSDRCRKDPGIIRIESDCPGRKRDCDYGGPRRQRQRTCKFP
jgi:hypothetical protein